MMELLCGPIASGKSTYCRQAAKDGAIILNDDSIVTAVHGGDYTLYKESLKPLYKTIENSVISTALAMGLRVIVDRPNHSAKMRRRYIAIGKSFDVMVKIVTFKRETPDVHGQRRFNSDSRGHTLQYWVDVAAFHDKLYEPPDMKTEFFDQIEEWEYKS